MALVIIAYSCKNNPRVIESARMILSIIGVPGSGKSTQANVLGERLGLPVFEVGEELRIVATKPTETGQKTAEYMKAGKPVPATILKRVFFDWLELNHVTQGFIIDGMPRRTFDLRLFHKQILPKLPLTMLPFIGVFELNITLDTTLKRINVRKQASNEKQARADESTKTTRFRYNWYQRNRSKIMTFYQDLGKWVEIDGTPQAAEVQQVLDQKVAEAIVQNKDRLIMIVGAAGSGKDTQAMKLEPLGYKVFSSGTAYREEMEKHTKLGNFIRDRYMNAGKPVPNKYHFKMLETHLDPLLNAGSKIAATGVIRKETQAKWFDNHLAERGDVLSKVIYLEVPKTDLIERLSLRRICPKCGFNYHLKFIPPKQEGICDKDGAKLIQREDETPEAIETRLKEQFYDVFEPVFKYYKKTNRLIVVDGKPMPDVVEKSVKKAVTTEKNDESPN